jgi:hypothetical protein
MPIDILAIDQFNDEDIGSINNPTATSPVTEYIAFEMKEPSTTHQPRYTDRFFILGI